MYIYTPEDLARQKLLKLGNEINLTALQQREICRVVEENFVARTKRKVVQVSESDRSSLLLCDDGTVWFSNSSPLRFQQLDLSELNSAKD